MSLGWEPAGPLAPLSQAWQRAASEWAQAAVRDPLLLEGAAFALRHFLAWTRFLNQTAALMLALPPSGS
ncbi:MAG TPA: hypothetical protein VKN99_01375 [Polyangia bacterium]|nr:hypothetical protein [Polyangia bacterium]